MRLLMVLTAMTTLLGIANADLMEPPGLAACQDKKLGDACHAEKSPWSAAYEGVCVQSGSGLWCQSKDEKKKPKHERSAAALGVVLLAVSAGSLEILRRKRRA